MRMLYPHPLLTTVFIALATTVHPSADQEDFDDSWTSYVDLRRDFREGNFAMFIRRIKDHLRRTLKRVKPGTAGIGPYEVFLDALVMMKIPMELADLETRQFVIRIDEAINVFEFNLTSANAESATNRTFIENLCPSYLNQQKDVVCWKVTRLAVSPRFDRVIIDWEAERFSPDGALITRSDSQTAMQNKVPKI